MFEQVQRKRHKKLGINLAGGSEGSPISVDGPLVSSMYVSDIKEVRKRSVI